MAEVFCSVQGEGPLLGVRQGFVRFRGCNLSCSYCDTRLPPGRCRVFTGGGVTELENPVTPERVAEVLQSYGRLHSVALTGGEPLLYPEFIEELEVPFPLYLESNMTLPESARRLRGKLRYVAGDFKLREVLPQEEYEVLRERTLECFRVLRCTKRRFTFCKLVLPERFDAAGVVEAVEEVRRWVGLVVLQPVWNSPPPVGELLRLQGRLMELVDTRIIPQTHKLLEVK